MGVTASRWLCPDTLFIYTTKDGDNRARVIPLIKSGEGRWETIGGVELLEVVRSDAQGNTVAPQLPVADATKEGRKIGKVRMDLVVQDMPRAIEALARVMTWALGSKGYNESDWLTVPDAIQKYHGGMHRHDNKEMRGQTFDDESGLHHAIHTAWNAMARVELILREEEAKNV